MPCLSWLLALPLLALAPAFAPAQVKLEWKFQVGDTFFVESQTTESGTVTLPDRKKFVHKTVQTVLVRFKVLKKTAAGYGLDGRIEQVVDKTSGAPVGAAAFALLKSLRGLSFQVTLQSTGEVTRIEGLEEALVKKSGGNEALLRQLRQSLTANSFKGFMETLFVALPAGEVKEGTPWYRNLAVSLGPLGTLEGRFTSRLEAREKEGDRIGVKAALKYLPPPKKADGQPFEIIGSSLKADQATGTILFNAQAGRVVRSKLTMHFQGELTLRTNSKVATLPVEQDQTLAVRFHLRNPLPAPRPSADK